MENLADYDYANLVELAKRRREAIKMDILTLSVKEVANKYRISRQRIHQIIGSATEIRLNHQAQLQLKKGNNV